LKKFLGINLLKPNTYFMYHRLQHSEILFSAHNTFMCLRASYIAIFFSIHNKLICFYNRGREYLLCGM
jgi:hypothetical protein